MRFPTVEEASVDAISMNCPDNLPTERSKVVLHELFMLLEEYGPAWYTQEHRTRALEVLLERDSR